jgi:hypothetical protein
MRRWIILAFSATVITVSCLVIVLVREHLARQARSPEEETRAAPVAKAAGRKPGIHELYEKLEPGMSRRQVEAVLGEPVFPPLEQPNGEVHAAYLGQEYAERSLLPHESPFMPAGISVTYLGGKLTEKSYNSQWVTR